MNGRINSKVLPAMALAAILVFATTGQYAFGDFLDDNLSGSATSIRLNPGGSQSVTYWINNQGPACDFSVSDPVTVNIVGLPSGITATPNGLTFTACGTSSSNTQQITYQVSNVSPPLADKYPISFVSADPASDPLGTSQANIEIFVKPPVPTLSSPSNGATISDSTPDLSWNGIDSTKVVASPPFNYEIEVDDSSGFGSPNSAATGIASGTTTFTVPSSLADGTYFWHVRVKQADNVGDYSTAFSFIISSDNSAPSVVSLQVSDSLIEDADAGNTFTVSIEYSEDMDQSVNPLIDFTPDVSTTLTSPTAGTWADSTHFSRDYTIADANVLVDDIDVGVKGAKDLGGNTQTSYDELDVFDIHTSDTTAPSVTSITVSDPLIADSDAALDNFQVTVVFSESMKTSVTPTISFSANPGPTLSGPTGGWSTTTSADDTYTATYVVDDANVEAGPIDVNVAGAQDLAGNPQSPSPTTLDNDLFSIDTMNPTVDSITPSITVISDANVGTGTFYVAVTFSEEMKTTAIPTLTFSPAASSLTLNAGLGGWSAGDTIYTAYYDVADDGLEVGPFDVNVGDSQDAAGNTQSPNPTTLDNNLFSIDTKNPTVAISVSDSEISESDAGAAAFSVTATFSESMDTSADPSVGFDGSACAASTLGTPSGSWSTTTYADDTFTVTYDVADNNDEGGDCDDIDVSVGDAQDLAGNAQSPDPTTAADQFSIDTKQPVLSLPTSISTWSPTPTKVITFSATASDANIAASPVNIETTGCTPASGSTFSLGTTEVDCSATDSFGNAAAGSFNVVLYQVTGFYQPVDMNGIYNKGKAGNTIPFKFNVYGGTGQITDTSIVKAFKKAGATCPGASTPSDVIEEYVSATGGSVLRYDTTGQQFVYNGQSIKNDANKCFTVTLIIDDGSTNGLATISANVQYIK